MTIPAERIGTYTRADGVLWRDTGSHIVALPAAGGDVVVLGGSSAHIWRLLDRPQSLPDLVESFIDESGAPPPEDEVAAAAQALVARGVARSEQGS